MHITVHVLLKSADCGLQNLTIELPHTHTHAANADAYIPVQIFPESPFQALKVQVSHLKVLTFPESPHSQNTLIHKQAATVVHYINPDGRYPDICLDIYYIDPDGRTRCPPTDQPILLNVFKIISSQINVRKLDNLHNLLDGLSTGQMVKGIQVEWCKQLIAMASENVSPPQKSDILNHTEGHCHKLFQEIVTLCQSVFNAFYDFTRMLLSSFWSFSLLIDF